MRKPRPELEAVTLPDLRKKKALAPMAVATDRRAINGTLRLAVPPTPPPAVAPMAPPIEELSRISSDGERSDDTALGATAHQRGRRRLTALVVLSLFVVVCALVLWLVARVREQERENLARESAERAAPGAPAVTATATATAPERRAAMVETAVPASTGTPQPTASDERLGTAKPTASVRATPQSAEPRASAPSRPSASAPSRPSASAPSRPSAKVSPSVPPTSATSSGSGGWIE